MRSSVVIATFNGLARLERAIASLATQEPPADEVIVVDNASTDGTREWLREAHPDVIVVEQQENLGFGRAVNSGVEAATGDVIVLINNDVVCEAGFLAAMLHPFSDAQVGMVAGVLLQEADPTRIDTAGLVFDRTMRTWEYLGNAPIDVLDGGVPAPAGPCGGAAAYRAEAFRGLGGFDEALFAYWEDADLAIRMGAAGWRCALATDARAVHAHGATTGAMSPRMRELDAYGRGFVVGRYGIMRRGPITAASAAVLDWPVFAVHAIARREVEPLRARRRGVRAGKQRALGVDRWPVARGVGEGLRAQWGATFDRLRGRGPAHFR